MYIYPHVFIQTLFSTAFPPKIFSFFTVRLVPTLYEVSPGWTAKEKILKFRSPDSQNMHIRHSF